MVRYFIVRGTGGEYVVYSLAGDEATPRRAGSPPSGATFESAIVAAGYSH